jgi:uncharacterized membrane protein
MTTAGSHRAEGDAATRRDIDAPIARVLILATYVSVALIAAGVVAMVAAGVSPLDAPRMLGDGGLLAAFVGLRPEGILGVGLIAIVLTPSVRVAASFVGYLAGGERAMAGVSLAILGVIAASVVLAIGLEG